MGRKPARVYTRARGPAYTRRKFMGGVPQSRITIFEHGLKKDYPYRVLLISGSDFQITHIALESARIGANKVLSEECGSQNYFMKIRPYPHQVLTIHKQAVGAGADRISQGMRHAFGVPVGTAARVKKGQILIEVFVNEEKIDSAKEALRKAKMKFPAKCRIKIEKIEPKNREGS